MGSKLNVDPELTASGIAANSGATRNIANAETLSLKIIASSKGVV